MNRNNKKANTNHSANSNKSSQHSTPSTKKVLKPSSTLTSQQKRKITTTKRNVGRLTSNTTTTNPTTLLSTLAQLSNTTNTLAPSSLYTTTSQIASLLTPTRLNSCRKFATNTDTIINDNDDITERQRGPSAPSNEEKMVSLDSIKKEYLLEHPEIVLRAQFNRIPTREEVTGLRPDVARDTVKYQFPGNKKLREDKMLPIRDSEILKLESPKKTRETLKLALNHSESKLTESLLSLAIAEPLPYRPNDTIATAEANITRQLSIAPSWDVDDAEHEKFKGLAQVKQSEAIYRGDVTKATHYLEKRIKEAEESNLPYFKPTGNAQIDEMNKRNLARGILPMPNFAGDNNMELTPDDLTQIDQMAQSLARHVEVSTSAKQPYDTASKIVKNRMADLPTDADEFFKNAGFPTPQSRTTLAYTRYLSLLSKRGTITQILDIFDEIRTRGIPQNTALTGAIIGALQRTNSTPQDDERMIKEMMLNKPNLDKTATYIGVPRWIPNVTIFPKTHRPIGAPEGFVSCAPQIATYGAKNIRGSFTPAVEYAFYLFEKAKENGTVPSRSIFTQLMKVCGAHKQFERSFALLEEFKRYAEGQHLDPGLHTNKREIALAKPHRDAKLQGFEVDQMMVVTLMNACQYSKKYELVEETFHRFWEQGLQPDAPMYNQVIISCVNGGYVEKAFKYFDQLQHFGHTPSIITYSSLIRACSAPDRPEFYPKAFEVFHECISAGFRPDRILFNDLLKVTVAQCDIHNMISLFRLMTRDFPHLVDMDVYTLIARGLGNSMSDDKLPGFGGYVLTRTGRTLFGQTITGDAEQDANITASKKIKLTREDRLAMLDALYSEVMLRYEAQDRIGGSGGQQFSITPRFLQEIVAGYASAASGILKWDRHERKEGREDPLLRLTSTHIDQLIERTWNKVVTLQKQHQHVFQLDGHTYRALFDMYGAADRMDDAVYHLLYLSRGLKVPIANPVYADLLDWCKKNAHQGPAFIIMDEMRRNEVPVPLGTQRFFEIKDSQMNTPLIPNTFPNMKPFKEDREAAFQQPKRDKKTGKLIPHPLDYDVSYKDF